MAADKRGACPALRSWKDSRGARAAARIALGLQEMLLPGNLNPPRHRGHARDSARAPWLMLQRESPADHVVATGAQHAVRGFRQQA
jgi:GDPmannose 4,6-dehydratase